MAGTGSGRHASPVLLYDSAISGNCYKVRLLLAQLGIEYERQDVDVVDRSGRRELLGGLNPALRVPTVVLDDGRPLGESNAILTYFAHGTPLLPDDRYTRAQVMQWLFFEQYSHEPNVAVLRFWRQHAPGEHSDAEIAARRAGAHAALDAMERQLERPFFVADRYTIADIALYAYTHVAAEAGLELDARPCIRAWLDRVAAQPGHVAMIAPR
jgi:glutathione S-transferase